MKWILLLLLSLQSLTYSTPLCDRAPPPLQELATAFDISAEENLIDATQKRWIHTTQERWEMTELNQKQLVLDWAQRNGLFSEWHPSEKAYDKALVFGATTEIMRKRFNYLIALIDAGIQFEEIVWLTGDRPLDYRIDERLENCATESDAARYINAQSPVPLPVRFITVPMKEGKKRPNTEDTLIAWLADNPNPCKALFISDQPFCGYQSAIVKATLPETFLFETAGPSSNPSSHPAAAAITLDAFARWLYTYKE